MNGVQSLAVSLCVSVTVSALMMGLYETQVRQPRTPRIAVVDLTRLFAAAEARAKDRVLRGSSGREGSLVGNGLADTQGQARGLEMQGLEATKGFGVRVETVLHQLSAECQCAIVVMAAVIGSGTAVADYTEIAAQRLGVTLRTEGGAP